MVLSFTLRQLVPNIASLALQALQKGFFKEINFKIVLQNNFKIYSP